MLSEAQLKTWLDIGGEDFQYKIFNAYNIQWFIDVLMIDEHGHALLLESSFVSASHCLKFCSGIVDEVIVHEFLVESLNLYSYLQKQTLIMLIYRINAIYAKK